MSLDQNTIALVTGASSGIGEATTRALRNKGVKVYAAARRLDRLEQLAGETGCIPVQLDVRDREAVLAFGREQPVDILVNNAGLGRALGSLWKAEVEDIEITVDTNVTAAFIMIKAVLPGMIERGRGHIVNMSSVTALYPLPMALYGATKGATHKLCRDLRQELQGTGIRVTEINPGRVVSEFYDVAVDDVEQRQKSPKHTARTWWPPRRRCSRLLCGRALGGCECQPDVRLCPRSKPTGEHSLYLSRGGAHNDL